MAMPDTRKISRVARRAAGSDAALLPAAAGSEVDFTGRLPYLQRE
jgi:hypothetical protein